SGTLRGVHQGRSRPSDPVPARRSRAAKMPASREPIRSPGPAPIGTIYGDAPNYPSGGGSLRGFFDYQTLQVAKLSSVTDGTSNTIMVGEVLPIQTIDSNFWNENGGTAGTTIPINWNSNTVPASDPSCLNGWSNGV